ncbi:hypothetical protein ACGRT8_01525 [Candidatus Phytoplasma australasiaticum]
MLIPKQIELLQTVIIYQRLDLLNSVTFSQSLLPNFNDYQDF